MKRTTLLLTLLLGISFSAIISQNKLLTIQDAIWKGRTSLAPKRLQALGFIPDSKKIAYIEKNELIILSAETGKTITTRSIASLNKGLKTASVDTVTAFEGLKWVNENQFYFTNKKGDLSVSASYNVVGQRIYIVGNVQEPNVWEQGRQVLDIQVMKKIKNWELRLNVRDLLAQDLIYFQDLNNSKHFESDKDNLWQKINYGQTISLSIKYNF